MTTSNAMTPDLGLLAELAGTWHGTGFNIAASPDVAHRRDVFLNLNLTSDTVSFDPVPATIHNRGFTQPDIELFGMTYLQHSTDATTGAPIHAEPGFWINQPPTALPPAQPPPGGQLIARMWSIPHGASMVAQGFAVPFTGPPVIGPSADPTGGADPAFSSFPSFNSTPLRPVFGAPGAAVSAAGTSPAGLPEYTVAHHHSLPPAITQQLVSDPVTLLQHTITQQIADGFTFDGVALNICTAPSVPFQTGAVDLPQFGGGIANLAFLQGVSSQRPNLSVALVYATFWIERLTHPDGRPPMLQLQYAQSALVDFPALNTPGQPNVSWPHVSVSTLHRTPG